MTKLQRPDEDEIAPDEADDGLLSADDLVDDAPRAVRERLKRELKTDGVRIAYEAMLDICRNKAAPAPARATAASTIFRAAGYLGRKADEEDSDNTGLDQATAAELQRLMRWRKAENRRLEKIVAGGEDDSDVGSSGGGGALD